MLAIAAGEFFKVAIRRHPQCGLLVLGVEWNQSVRVVGLMGDRADMEAHAALLPNRLGDDIRWQSIQDSR